MIKKEFKGYYNFQDVFIEFQPRILRYLTRFVGVEEAEDLTQEVFIKINRDLKKFKGEAKLSTWIYKIATNKAIDRLRQFKTLKFTADNIKLVDLLSESGKEDGDGIFEDKKSLTPTQQIIRKEMNHCIRKVIDNLPKHYSAVIILKYLEEFKNQEISKIMNITIATVKIRLHRAKIELKKVLGNRCIFYYDVNGNLSCESKN